MYIYAYIYKPVSWARATSRHTTVRARSHIQTGLKMTGSAPLSVWFDSRQDIRFDLSHARTRHTERQGSPSSWSRVFPSPTPSVHGFCKCSDDFPVERADSQK